VIRVVIVGSPEHAEGEQRMAAQLARIRAGSGDGWRHVDLQVADETPTDTDRMCPDATRIQALRRRAFALACRRQMLGALTAGEGAVAWSAMATLLRPAVPG
jgi:hypothetical protein